MELYYGSYTLARGGFYEQLVGLVKQILQKGMRYKLLYWEKLMTLLIEVKAIINTCPLTYVHGEFQSWVCVDTSSFFNKYSH